MEQDKKHSTNFLNEQQKIKSPFKTPDNYFNNLSETMNVKNVESTLPLSSGFNTPDSYFKNFKVTIQKKKTKVAWLLPYMATAAAVVIGFFISHNQQVDASYSHFNRNEVISYLANQEDLDIQEIIDNSKIDIDKLLFTSLEDTIISDELLYLELNENDLLEY